MAVKHMVALILGAVFFSTILGISQNRITRAYEVCNEPCDTNEVEIQKGLEILERQYGVRWVNETYENCMILKNNQSVALFCKENGARRGCEYCRFR